MRAIARLVSTPPVFFLISGLIAGLAYLVAFPPLSVADEPAHFYRAFAVASGDLLPDLHATGPGGIVPASLTRLVPELRVGEELLVHPEWRVDPGVLRGALDWPLHPDRRGFVSFPTSCQFPFVAYLPQALGVGFGILLELPPARLVYLGRFTNLLLATSLAALALWVAPFGRWPLALFALTPMAVSLRGSLSADAPTNAAAFLAVCSIAALGWGEPRRWHLPLTMASASLLALTKLPYALLLLAVAVVPRERLELRRRAGTWLLALLLFAVAAGFSAWTTARYGADVSLRPGVDRDRQVADALREPLRFAGVVSRHYIEHIDRYVAQAVGAQLGWLDVRLPLAVVWAYLIVLLGLCIWTGSPGIEIAPWRRLWLLAVGTVIAVLVAASQYAGWTPYGADFIEGVQGRYFLPLTPLLPIALHRAPRSLSRRLPLATGLGVFHAGVTWVAVAQVITRHYGPS